MQESVSNKNIIKAAYFMIMVGLIIFSSCTYWDTSSFRYLIPEGYEGMIVISWDQENGVAIHKDGDYEVYRIPPNGLLRTNVRARSLNIIEEQFYSYSQATGKQVRLKIIDPSISKDTIESKNEFYKVGLLSGGHEGLNNMIFFITRDKNSKFMDETYCRHYYSKHEDELYQNLK
ncbi:hypothetical protein SAMN06265348_11737 [Pedobacter westerhofensis]|uniref:DUF6843 domain-containing protein n=1 Tax=Pedobacter westerhofensis TaxID=425512 RepID=A0A521FR74_9SPHI|nr:hypothetical protein [Pedobacter westerhofensis]SMO98636.1 hypothetical protein SAMN06265348_11737 [Pedobacter westerhofensis]